MATAVFLWSLALAVVVLTMDAAAGSVALDSAKAEDLNSANAEEP